jgi:hypothetical protein
MRQGDIDAGPVLESFRSPRPEEVDRLFEKLGIAKIFNNVRWPGTSSTMVKRKLRNLVDRRNQIAHGEVDVQAYKFDVTSNRTFIRGFSQVSPEHRIRRILLKLNRKVWRGWPDSNRRPAV